MINDQLFSDYVLCKENLNITGNHIVVQIMCRDLLIPQSILW